MKKEKEVKNEEQTKMYSWEEAYRDYNRLEQFRCDAAIQIFSELSRTGDGGNRVFRAEEAVELANKMTKKLLQTDDMFIGLQKIYREKYVYNSLNKFHIVGDEPINHDHDAIYNG